MIDPSFADINPNQLYEIILAIGGLGTAAYGLVDATKSFGERGPSQVGFKDIKKVVSRLLPESPDPGSAGTGAEAAKAEAARKIVYAATRQNLLETLHSNWINGMAMTDQKAVAKALIKLMLSPDTTRSMASETGSDPGILRSIAGKLRPSATLTAADSVKQGADSLAPNLTPSESDELGRFDLALSALLDQGYQRGDQRYRNFAKLLAVGFSVLIAVVTTGLTLWKIDRHMALAAVAGLLATPLAPVAKDLASTVQAGAKIAQYWKK